MTKHPTQKDFFYRAGREIAERDIIALDLLFGHNPITDDELRKNIRRRPSLWGRYAGYLGARPGDGGIYWGA